MFEKLFPCWHVYNLLFLIGMQNTVIPIFSFSINGQIDSFSFRLLLNTELFLGIVFSLDFHIHCKYFSCPYK